MVELHKDKDGGWGWVVVAGSFLVQIVLAGFFHAIGILYVEMKDVFFVDSSEVAWVGSLQTGFLYLVAPVITVNTERLTPRVVTLCGIFVSSAGLLGSVWVRDFKLLYLTLGVIPGVGFSMASLGSILILNEYFLHKLPLAIGIATGSTGLGIAAFGPLTRYLLQEYGFQGCLMTITGVALQCSVGAALFFPHKDRKRNEGKSKGCVQSLREIFDFRLLMDIEFVMFLFSNFCSSVSYWVPLAFLPDLCISIGYSLTDAANIIIIFGFSSAAGRVIFTFVSHRFPRSGPTVYAVGLFAAGISTFLLPYCTMLAELDIFAIVFGVSTGGLAGLTLVLTSVLFGPERMSRSLGIVVFFQGVGGLIGSPVATSLSNLVQTDTFMYSFGGAVYFLSGLSLFPVVVKNLFCKAKYDLDYAGVNIEKDVRRVSTISIMTSSSDL